MMGLRSPKCSQLLGLFTRYTHISLEHRRLAPDIGSGDALGLFHRGFISTFLLLRNFSVPFSESPHVCFTLF